MYLWQSHRSLYLLTFDYFVFVGCGAGKNCIAGHFVSCPDQHDQLHRHQNTSLQHGQYLSDKQRSFLSLQQGDGPGGLAAGLHGPRATHIGPVRHHPQADCPLQTVGSLGPWVIRVVKGSGNVVTQEESQQRPREPLNQLLHHQLQAYPANPFGLSGRGGEQDDPPEPGQRRLFRQCELELGSD